MISPIIFCTIVLGIGSIRKAAKVGKVGGLALGYFVVMSTVALAIGLVVGNILQPGAGLRPSVRSGRRAPGRERRRHRGHHRTSCSGSSRPRWSPPLRRRLGAVDAVRRAARRASPSRRMGSSGRAGAARRRALRAAGVPRAVDDHVGSRRSARSARSRPWSAPPGWSALRALGQLMLGFYITCAAVRRSIVLGALLQLVTGLNIFSLLKYLAREFLLIVSTSSSESALPRLIAKMEHVGVVPARRRHHRAHRLLVQPRRHRDLPDDGVAVHRRRVGQAAVARRADLACSCS